MRVKIDRGGSLWIERAGTWKLQFCPDARIERPVCGDWCPGFNEPENGELIICRNMWDEDDTIIDERGSNETVS